MKLNFNKLCFLFLTASCIGITIFLFAISLLTEYVALQYATIILIFALSIFLVKTVHRYPLYIKK